MKLNVIYFLLHNALIVAYSFNRFSLERATFEYESYKFEFVMCAACFKFGHQKRRNFTGLIQLNIEIAVETNYVCSL